MYDREGNRLPKPSLLKVFWRVFGLHYMGLAFLVVISVSFFSASVIIQFYTIIVISLVGPGFPPQGGQKF